MGILGRGMSAPATTGAGTTTPRNKATGTSHSHSSMTSIGNSGSRATTSARLSLTAPLEQHIRALTLLPQAAPEE